MKVTMTTSVSTLEESYASGSVYDLPDLLATQWVAAGYAKAEAVVEQPPVAPVVEQPPVAPVVEQPQPSRRKQRLDKADLL